MAGGRTALLHHIFLRTGITPDEVIAKPAGVRALIFASMRIQLEEEERERREQK